MGRFTRAGLHHARVEVFPGPRRVLDGRLGLHRTADDLYENGDHTSQTQRLLNNRDSSKHKVSKPFPNRDTTAAVVFLWLLRSPQSGNGSRSRTPNFRMQDQRKRRDVVVRIEAMYWEGLKMQAVWLHIVCCINEHLDPNSTASRYVQP